VWGGIRQLGRTERDMRNHQRARAIFPESWGKISESEWGAEEGARGCPDGSTALSRSQGQAQQPRQASLRVPYSMESRTEQRRVLWSVYLEDEGQEDEGGGMHRRSCTHWNRTREGWGPTDDCNSHLWAAPTADHRAVTRCDSNVSLQVLPQIPPVSCRTEQESHSRRRTAA
jgi:hypothetical protein